MRLPKEQRYAREYGSRVREGAREGLKETSGIRRGGIPVEIFARRKQKILARDVSLSGPLSARLLCGTLFVSIHEDQEDRRPLEMTFARADRLSLSTDKETRVSSFSLYQFLCFRPVFSFFPFFFSVFVSLSLSLFLRWQGCTDSPSPRQKSRWRLVDWRQRRVSLEWLVQSILESIGFDWDCELYSTPLALWNTIRSIRWLAIVFEFIRDFMNWMSTECIYVESKLLCNYWAIVSRLLIISFLSVTAIKGSRSLKEVILSPELSKIIFNHLNISSFDSTTSFSSTVPVASIHEVAVCDHASGKDISRQRDYYYYYYKFINNHQLAKQLHDWKIIQNVASFAHLIVLFWVYNVPSCLRITN